MEVINFTTNHYLGWNKTIKFNTAENFLTHKSQYEHELDQTIKFISACFIQIEYTI